MHRKTLKQLYADHTGKVSDKWSLYLSEYDRLFDEFRDRQVRVLEIGIQNGGSLEIWSKYFQEAQILVGCDINPDCDRLTYEDGRISVVVGDATQSATTEKIRNHSAIFDIVIEDGSHRSSHIIKAFANYFPVIEDGGVFVAEDLHCSYWQEFEGGLYDPFSSIAFFKRLADIINHEHWGVEKQPSDALKGFITKYDLGITDEDLAKIHSVEFVNSMCVVRKRARDENILGCRFIAGVDENVVPGHLPLRSTSLVSPSQGENEWATRIAAPDEDYVSTMQRLAEREARIDGLDTKLSDLEREIVTRDRTISIQEAEITQLHQAMSALKNSTSWRLSSPIRIVGRQVRRMIRAIQIVNSFVNRAGGFRSALARVWQIYQRVGLTGLRRRIAAARAHQGSPADSMVARNDYSEWIKRYDTITEEMRSVMRANINQWNEKPLISVLMPTFNPNPVWLIAAIESVQAQIYQNWELCIADDASTNPMIREILDTFLERDPRIKVTYRESNGHISLASNSALELVSGKWTALLDHDDLLAEHALYWVAESINRHPHARLIYSDEDKIDSDGKRYNPYFKCDWNVDLFYSHNMFCHLGVFDTELLRDIGGFRAGFEGAQDYDLTLRCTERVDAAQIFHIPRVLYHWRMHDQSTAQDLDAKPYAALAGERAIQEHLDRCGIAGRVKLVDNGYKVDYALPAAAPRVSIIIPTRNGLSLIRQCIESILKKTTYPSYEILIIDNGSDDAATLSYFGSLASEPRVRVIQDARPFNYSALNNAAVALAHGDVIALLNNDIEIISPDWLSEMVSHALRPGVGAVGARLWYPNNTLQHGGVILGVGGVAGHSHKHLVRSAPGYFSRAALVQSLSAVTAACLVVTKSKYEEVGGLNEKDLAVAFNDVDFCLRLREAGYRNVWTPFAECYHHESATRGLEDSPEKHARFMSEVKYMERRWSEQLLNDPAYSPNLTLDYEDFSIAWPPRVGRLSRVQEIGKELYKRNA